MRLLQTRNKILIDIPSRDPRADLSCSRAHENLMRIQSRAGMHIDKRQKWLGERKKRKEKRTLDEKLQTLDEWSFDVFSLSEAAQGVPVKYMGYDLLNRYGMIHKFKVPPTVLESFLGRVEEGYCRHRNPYHNNLHAADVAQTMHYVLCRTGLMVSFFLSVRMCCLSLSLRTADFGTWESSRLWTHTERTYTFCG